jgi:DNA-binding response OmpR family regulator
MEGSTADTEALHMEDEAISNGIYRAGALEVRPGEHLALAGNRPLPLTVRELALLAELARNSEKVLTREQLYEAVWGRRWRASDRSVDVYVSRLRTKLATAIPDMSFIHTHFGIGYRFSAEPHGGGWAG